MCDISLLIMVIAYVTSQASQKLGYTVVIIMQHTIDPVEVKAVVG